MPKDRYYTNFDLKIDEIVSIQDKEASHMLYIMRKKQDDIVEIINGHGKLAEAKIVNTSKQKVDLKILKVSQESPKKKKLILVQSLIKQDRLELLLEKCTELGVDEFWIINLKNSIKLELSKNRLDRFQNILIAAIKQSGRLFLPKIVLLNSLKDLTKAKGQIFYGSTHKDSIKLKDALQQNDNNIFMIIGPEAGFSKDEEEYFKENLKAQGINLNENILRAETAAITSIAIISHLLQV